MYKKLKNKLYIVSLISLSSLLTSCHSNQTITNQPSETITSKQLNVSEEGRSSNSLLGLAQVSSNGSRLNIRSSANLNSSILSKVEDKSYLEIYSESTNWYYVKYNSSKFGYVYKKYTNLASKSIKTVTPNSLNIRKGPSTSYTKIGTLTKNSKIGVLSTTNSWAKIIFDGSKIGYVHNSYLSTNTSYKYPGISLSVNNYKQFDSRWANEKLGKSSKTFKSSGCAVTALAIMESFRTKKNITPLEYSKKVSFNSSGAIYWPTTYYNVTTSSSYLTAVYNTLKKGQPAMLGLKDKNGAQHYVVIYGFTGGYSLDSSRFLISDPGSSYRTKLSEILAIKPYFYKIITIK